MIFKRRKILVSILISALFLFSYGSSFAEIRVFFSPEGGVAEEIIKQIDNAESYIDIAMYSFTYEPIAEAIIRAKNRGVKIRILMDKGQSQGRYSKYKFFLDNDIAIIQDRHAGIMHNKIAVIDGKILFTGSYNWSKSAEERNEENLLEFINEEEIIKVYQERLDYLWEFNQENTGTESPPSLEILPKTKTQTVAKRVRVQVSLKSADLIYNNHVGNEWSTYSEVEGYLISGTRRFEKVYDKPEVRLKFYARATEYDKISDVGSNTCYINLSLQDGVKTKLVSLDVIVKENRGRYSGNTALWRFTYRITIEPME